MGLYLAAFSDDVELDGVEVGLYADFSVFRNQIVQVLEPEGAGSRFPVLILHSDCDGEWSPAEAAQLERELTEIGDAFRQLPAVPFNSEWKREVAVECNIKPRNLYECFFDVDGRSLIDRLIGLARISQERNVPILFQ